MVVNNNLLTLMDSFFEDIRPLASSVGRVISVNPALNVKEYADKYEISMTIPGIDPKKVKVELTDKILTISYNHEESEEKKDCDMIRQEYRHYSFIRNVVLPKNIDSNSIEAESTNGILTIRINKTPESQPKPVEVKIKE